MFPSHLRAKGYLSQWEVDGVVAISGQSSRLWTVDNIAKVNQELIMS